MSHVDGMSVREEMSTRTCREPWDFSSRRRDKGQQRQQTRDVRHHVE